MLGLLLSKAEGLKHTSKPCHVGIHLIALPENSQMSTHVPGFLSFFLGFLHHFELVKLLATAEGLILILTFINTYSTCCGGRGTESVITPN